MEIQTTYYPIFRSRKSSSRCLLREVVTQTPLDAKFYVFKESMMQLFFLKREDLQQVRSYKIRGAYNKMSSLYQEVQKSNGIVCASAGNHAQGVAFACAKLANNVELSICLCLRLLRKVDQVTLFGGDWIKVVLEGDTFDDAFAKANTMLPIEQGKTFVHPFDDEKIIEGQATVGSRNYRTIKRTTRLCVCSYRWRRTLSWIEFGISSVITQTQKS